MKTIKTILRELLKPPSNKKPKTSSLGSTSSSEVKPSDNNINKNSNNLKTNETETNENSGDNRVDPSCAPKVTTSVQEEPGDSGEPRQESGGNSGGESGIVPRNEEPRGRELKVDVQTSSPLKDEEIEKRIREAFEKGIVEGRNQQIEEKFFPKYDGIPEFRGASSFRTNFDDIFSIAREA